MANDHYVPQLYLKNFGILSKPSHVYCYKRGQKTEAKPIKRVASIEDYDLLIREDATFKSDTIANLIKVVENNVAPIIQRLLKEPSATLSKEDKECFCLFVAYLINRVPASRNYSVNFFKASQVVEAKFTAEEKDIFDERMKDSGLSAEKLEEMRLKAVDFEKHFTVHMDPDVEGDMALMPSFLGAQFANQILNDKWITFLNNGTRKEFITSDNPVILSPDPTVQEQIPYLAHALVYLPLSPEKAVLFVNHKPVKTVVNVKREWIEDINSRLIGYARDCLFSRTLDKEIEREKGVRPAILNRARVFSSRELQICRPHPDMCGSSVRDGTSPERWPPSRSGF
jgi:hypothetical protein